MKKIFLFLLIIALGFLAFYFYHQQSPVTDYPLPSPQEKPLLSIIKKLEPITINARTYYYTYALIKEFANLKLYPNFQAQLSSEELAKTYHCSILVNAGFYSKDFKPLGWLVSNGQPLSKPISSNLFNGYLSISNQKASISSFVQTNSTIGLQTGPLLIQNSQSLILKIKNDDSRRRLVAGLTKDNGLLFIAIILKDSAFSGPLLADTPLIIQAISQKINKEVVDAINLDGGTASTFYTEKIHLKEFSPIGSFFCLQQKP